MKKNYIKYIESMGFLLLLIILVKSAFFSENGYLIEFSLGNFIYLFIIYLFLRIFIPFVQNKTLGDIFRSRLNSLVVLLLIVVNLIIAITLNDYSYSSFFIYSLETLKTGGLFVSIFGKLYTLLSKNALISISAIIIFFLFLYTFGKIIGFIAREREKRKSGEYYINKQRNKEEKIRLKKANKEEKRIRKTEKELEGIEKEEIIPDYLEDQGDFLVDIKKEFQTIMHKEKDSRNNPMDDDKRRKIKEEIRKRYELKKEIKDSQEEEEKTKIFFVKEENEYIEEKEEKATTYPNEIIDLSNSLDIPINKLLKAIDLVHRQGVKGFAILEKELQVDSDDAERIYMKVKKMKEYK